MTENIRILFEAYEKEYTPFVHEYRDRMIFCHLGMDGPPCENNCSVFNTCLKLLPEDDDVALSAQDVLELRESNPEYFV